MSAVAAPSTRLGLSATVRGIYVIRYLLFSGGTAIAFAMLERTMTHSQHSGVGLAVGFVVGLTVFRSQMRRLFWPQLLLSQQGIYMIRRRQAVVISWQQLKNVLADDREVTLELRTPMISPQGFPTEAIRLNPLHFGTSLTQLQTSLRFFLIEANRRKHLPKNPPLSAGATQTPAAPSVT